jgi:hypothetical protein
MRRRTFINFIGSAIIGTAIALKLPDGLVPLNHLSERPRISFKAMQQAHFMSTGGGRDEPNIMLVSKGTLGDIRELMSLDHLPYGNEPAPPPFGSPYIYFQNALVIDQPQILDDVIQVHTRKGAVKEFYFI